VWTRERFENFGWPALGQYRLVVVAQLARRLLGPEIETRLSQPLEARQLEEAFEHLVDVHETTVLVLHERHGWAVVHESMKAVFAFPERPTLLGPLQHRFYRHRQAAQNFAVLGRSEEHTSELQSRSDLVCRLLLEKKKSKKSELLQAPHDVRQTGDLAGIDSTPDA